MSEFDTKNSETLVVHTGRPEPDGEPGVHAGMLQLLKAEVRKRLCTILASTGAVLVLAIAAVSLMPNQYVSVASIMPLDQQTFSNHSYLNSMIGIGASGLGSASSLLTGSQQNATETLKTVAASNTVRDAIINQFALQQVYHTANYTKTRNALGRHVTIENDKASGVITLAVRDQDKSRAQKMAAAYINELNKMVYTLNSSSARRERIFLEQRLKSVRDDIDKASSQLSEFSSHNLTLDPQIQAQQVFASVTKIQAEIVASQTELAELRTRFTDDNPQIQTLRARIAELQNRLQKERSAKAKPVAAEDTDQTYPSMRQLPYLGVKYGELYQQLFMRKTLYEALTKQYELAKIQEAKEIPSLSVLDEPAVPELKSGPHRTMLVVSATLLGFLLSLSVITLRAYWSLTNNRHPFQDLLLFLFNVVRGVERS